ncbi:uncharacterized protein LOC143029777 isoform X2 [Oratosquilla oratoria]|uniref:uncharacterized protein LOC143029777 isoform X2 n=1 Tax=Oratosquilla oratoria TaxID=337810 RepID=UPI003F76BA96
MMSSIGREEKKKRVTLTLAQKLEIVKKLEVGASVKHICEEYGIKKQTVSDIRRAKDKLNEFALKYSVDGYSSQTGALTARKHMRVGGQKELDEAVLKWYIQQKACGSNVPLSAIANACQQFSKHLGLPSTVSDSWLWRFRNRHGLRGEGGSSNIANVEHFRIKLNDLIKKEDLLLSQIYNADETGLFWHSLPNNIQAYQGEDVNYGKKMSKERISALFCANADGMHRLKVCIVGKYALKDYMYSMPVHYYCSTKAWFTSSIFLDWFHKTFIPEVRRYQEDVLKFDKEDVKALLLLDIAPTHPNADQLVSSDGKIRIMYLPASTPSVIQPMYQGVISACKRRYQRRYLDEIMVIPEEQDLDNNTRGLHTLENIKKYTIKSAIFNFANSWKDLKISTLANSWKKLLIDVEPDYDFEGLEATDFHYMLQCAGETEVTLENVQDWLDENDNEPGHQILSAEEIVAEVVGKEESSWSDKEDNEMALDLPKLSEVRKCMDTLQQFVEYTKNKEISNHYGNLRILREAIIREQYQSGKHIKLETFFKPVTMVTSASSEEPVVSTSHAAIGTSASAQPTLPYINSSVKMQSTSTTNIKNPSSQSLRKKQRAKTKITKSYAEDTSELEETSESEEEPCILEGEVLGMGGNVPWLEEGEESELEEGELTVLDMQLEPKTEPNGDSDLSAELIPPDECEVESMSQLSSKHLISNKEGFEEAQEIKEEGVCWDFMEIKEEPLEEEEFGGKKRPPEGTRLIPKAKKSKDVIILEENNNDKTLVVLDWYRSDLSLVINQDDRVSAYPLTGENFGKVWHEARATYGYTKGKVFYEVKVMQQLNTPHQKTREQYPSVIRIGWSFDEKDKNFGSAVSYCPRDNGKASRNRKSKVQCFYKDFKEDNVVGCFLDLDMEPAVISFTLNGEHQGVAYEISYSKIGGAALYPHIITRNCPFKEEDTQTPFLGYGPGNPGITEDDVILDPVQQSVPKTTQIPGLTETTSVQSSFVKYLRSINFSQLTLQEKAEIRKRGRPTPDIYIQQKSSSGRKEHSHQFSSDLYKKYKWLCGCDEVMALYCFPCLLFGGDSLWTESGVMDFEHLTQKIGKHEISVKHINNLIDLSLLSENNGTHLDTTFRLSTAKHNELVRKNREALSKVIDCIKFYGKCKPPAGGHNEIMNSKNPKGFQSLLDFACVLDYSLDTHLKTAVFKGRIKSIQSELLECMFEICREKILIEVKNAEYLAIMCDEITDIYDKVHMIIVLRYELEGKPVERFWGVFSVIDQSEKSVASVLLKELSTLVGDSPDKLIAQTYDSTTIRKGTSKSVQARIKEVYNNAHYVHCYSHQLNLVLEKAVSQNESVRVFFNSLSGIPGFFSECPQRMTMLDSFARQRMTKPYAICNLKRTVSAIYEMKEVLIECCTALESSNSRSTGFMAAGIKRILSDPEFEFWLEFFSKVMPHVDKLCTQLQFGNINAAEISDSLIVFTFAVKRLRDECDTVMSAEQMRRNYMHDIAAAKEVCDVILLQCRERLSFNYHLEADKLFSVSNFSQYAKEFPCNELAQAVAAYPMLEIFKLRAELSVLYSRDMFKSRSLVDLYKVIINNQLQSAFSETVQLLKILITTPMMTAETERCFTTMKRIKSCLHNNVLNNNASALTMVSIEESIIKTKDFNEEVIDYFAKSKNQCMDFIFR